MHTLRRLLLAHIPKLLNSAFLYNELRLSSILNHQTNNRHGCIHINALSMYKYNMNLRMILKKRTVLILSSKQRWWRSFVSNHHTGRYACSWLLLHHTKLPSGISSTATLNKTCLFVVQMLPPWQVYSFTLNCLVLNGWMLGSHVKVLPNTYVLCRHFCHSLHT